MPEAVPTDLPAIRLEGTMLNGPDAVEFEYWRLQLALALAGTGAPERCGRAN